MSSSSDSSESSVKPIAVIGMGNPLMSDEGVGVRIIASLQAAELANRVDILDLGTSSMRAVHALEGRDAVVFVDCALMGTAPGTIRRFTPEEVESRKAQPRLSLHEGDLLNTIALARRLGTAPPTIVIFGIEPDLIEPGESLSAALACHLEDYVVAIQQEVARIETKDPQNVAFVIE
jgi:hydrogenase maturation protease